VSSRTREICTFYRQSKQIRRSEMDHEKKDAQSQNTEDWIDSLKPPENKIYRRRLTILKESYTGPRPQAVLTGFRILRNFRNRVLTTSDIRWWHLNILELNIVTSADNLGYFVYGLSTNRCTEFEWGIRKVERGRLWSYRKRNQITQTFNFQGS
jgi:hypothetical protein